MNLPEHLEKAFVVGAKFHASVKDKVGRPSWLHPMRVIANVDNGTDSEENYLCMIVAALHDTVEDTEATLDSIEEDFGKTIRDAVDAMTRRKGETYWNYLERCKKNPLARRVKIADATDNYNRKDGLSGTREWKSFQKRYVRALEFLRSDREIVAEVEVSSCTNCGDKTLANYGKDEQDMICSNCAVWV